MNVNQLSRQVARKLKAKKLTISICESCTGGMLGSIITSIPGSSSYFCGGVIAYCNEIKRKLVGVKSKTLEKYGAVSAQCAKEMALGVLRLFKADIGVAITGIAGPDGGTEDKSVGLVYIAISTKGKSVVLKNNFTGGRNVIRRNACYQTLELLINILNK